MTYSNPSKEFIVRYRKLTGSELKKRQYDIVSYCRLKKWPKKSVSRVLFPPAVACKKAMIIHLGSPLPTTSSNQTQKLRADHPQTFLYSILLRMGFTELLTSPPELVSSYLTLSPLPSFAKASAGMPAVALAKEGGLLSVALSLGSPPVPVKNHPVLWSPDFPPPGL